MGTRYKGLYRKWFGVFSFQRNNQYNVINGQRNNENPLYMYMVERDLYWTMVDYTQNKVQDELVRVQPGFKSELLTSVEVFKKDATEFGTNYENVSKDDSSN